MGSVTPPAAGFLPRSHRRAPRNSQPAFWVLRNAVPGAQRGLRVDRAVAEVDLEVEVAGRARGVAGAADMTDDVAWVDLVSLLERRWPDHVCVEILAALAEPADDDEIPVEAGIEGALDHRSRADRRLWRPAAGGEVEALVDAPAVASGAEPTDRAAGAVRPPDGEEVAEEPDLAHLLGVSLGGTDQNEVGAVWGGRPGVRKAVPALHLVGARRHVLELDPPHLATLADDPN